MTITTNRPVGDNDGRLGSGESTCIKATSVLDRGGLPMDDTGAGLSALPSPAKSHQALLLRLQEGLPVSEQNTSLVYQALGVWARL